MLGRRFDKILYPKNNNNNNNNNNKTVLGTRNHFESAEIDHKNLAEKEDVSCMIKNLAEKEDVSCMIKNLAEKEDVSCMIHPLFSARFLPLKVYTNKWTKYLQRFI